MRTLLAFTLGVCMAGSAAAQVEPTRKEPLETKTIELKHMKPDEAISLLRPYLVNIGGSVSGVAPNMPIITIKDVPENLARMERVLAKYDHSPATIRLVFQLIEADTGPRMVATSAEKLSSDLDATLRSVLRFSAYRLLAQGIATSGEYSTISQKLAKADDISYYSISAEVGTIRLSDVTLQADGATMRNAAAGQVVVDTTAVGSVHLKVQLSRQAEVKYENRPDYVSVISTGLDVPLGHTVVLGTAAAQKGGVALILTVKPELVRAK
jgi:hypothetical protein